MKITTIETVMRILDEAYPTLAMHEVHGRDPFHMLIAVVLSQRARDSVTVPTAQKLFKVFPTSKEFVTGSLERIEEIIRPIGFSHEKAIAIKEISRILVDQYQGKVPETEEELLKLPKVGRKTANIILTTFFDTPQIAVDIHVHRITNRLGWVSTAFPLSSSTPSEERTWRSGKVPSWQIQSRDYAFDSSAKAIRETEQELSILIPKELHAIVNRVFVAHGQTICLPRNPRCEKCPVEKHCAKVGVGVDQ